MSSNLFMKLARMIALSTLVISAIPTGALARSLPPNPPNDPAAQCQVELDGDLSLCWADYFECMTTCDPSDFFDCMMCGVDYSTCSNEAHAAYNDCLTPKCGRNVCETGQFCCNPLCGMCAWPGEACTLGSCDPPVLSRR